MNQVESRRQQTSKRNLSSVTVKVKRADNNLGRYASEENVAKPKILLDQTKFETIRERVFLPQQHLHRLVNHLRPCYIGGGPLPTACYSASKRGAGRLYRRGCRHYP